ncbi:MAG: tetratricopeptide repeat protein [Planctomycetota bacterium]
MTLGLACVLTAPASQALSQPAAQPVADPAVAIDTPAHRQFLFAYKLMRRGELVDAADEFRRHLDQYPDAPKRGDSAYYLALILRKNGDPAAAGQALQNAPDPTLIDLDRVNLLRGQVLLDTGELDMAVAVLERVPAQPDAAESSVAYASAYLLGGAYRQLGNRAAAVARLERASQGPPALRQEALLELARLHAEAGALPAARAALAPVADPDRPGDAAPVALLLAGRLASADGEPDTALRLFGALLAAHPDAPETGWALAGRLRALHALERDAEALQAFDAVQRQLEGSARVAAVYAVGRSAQRLEDHALAVRLLGSVAVGYEDDGLADDVLLRLAISQRELNQTDAMRRTLDALARRHPDSPLLIDAVFVSAATADAQADPAAQVASLTPLVERGPSYPYYRQALQRRAEAYRQAGQLDASLADLERMLASESTTDASAPLASGSQTSARLQAVELRLALGQPDRALASAQALVEDESVGPADRRRAVLHYAEAQRLLGDTDGARGALRVLLEAGEDDAVASLARFRLGLLEVRSGEPDAGAARLIAAGQDERLAVEQRVLGLRVAGSAQRQRVNTLTGQAQADAQASATAALRIAVEIAGAEALEVEEALWLADQELAQDNPNAAIALVEPRVQAADDPALARQAGLRLADAYALAGQNDRALGLYAQLAAASTTDTTLRDTACHRQAVLLLSIDRPGDAVQALAPAVARSAEAPPLSAAQTLRLDGKAQLAWARQARLQGEVRPAIDHLEQARRSLKRVVTLYAGPELRPNPQHALLDLAEVEWLLDNPAAAERALQDLVDAEPQSVYGQLARARLDLADGRSGRAAARLDRIEPETLAQDSEAAERVTQLRRQLAGEHG